MFPSGSEWSGVMNEYSFNIDGPPHRPLLDFTHINSMPGSRCDDILAYLQYCATACSHYKFKPKSTFQNLSERQHYVLIFDLTMLIFFLNCKRGLGFQIQKCRPHIPWKRTTIDYGCTTTNWTVGYLSWGRILRQKSRQKSEGFSSLSPQLCLEISISINSRNL